MERFFFLTFGDQDLALVSQLAGIYVCDQDGGTPLDSDLDQGAGEEANSSAGGARGDGGVVVGGSNFHQHQDFEFQTSLHLVGVRDAWQEALDFCVCSREC